MLPASPEDPQSQHSRREIRPARYKAPHWLGWLVVLGFSVLIVIVAIAAFSRWINKTDSDMDRLSVTDIESEDTGNLVWYPGRNIDFSSKFNIPQSTQMEAAQAVGLPKPMADEAEVKKYMSRLTKIQSTRNYVVDKLDYSLPYLTKSAARELEIIAADFADILERNNLPHYRIIVTSVLRTEESVKQLQRSGNINSTTNSTHCYGTTFDIAYMRFDKNDRTTDYMNDGNLKLVLGQALLNEQRAGHIYVKYEIKQACFHITSRL